ncbi:EAL domain-containing protein [Vibrio sp. S11_S32]|uniref:bifunctional diguanylate cyclase/phosphodiesterase n=1 Tax=Vibrio sp. S11_S32 TaxID=2720225 RepID=UPI0016800CFD|nr:EAL domain-containing protein [Vibrio sp. S11_S32]MBD1577469.1 EAL domain-containing protein [Vibrio sp. S11_S32]
MTLYKQLLIWVMGIFLATATVLFAIEFNNTRDYLNERQIVEVDNTVDAVGLALTPYLLVKNDQGATDLIHSMFDSSYYSDVKLTPIEEGKVIEIASKETKVSAPGWFIFLSDIEPYTKTVRVGSDWQQLADLTVTSNPNLAYQKLWKTAEQLLLTFFLSGLVVIALFSFIFRKILAPLRSIQENAKKIADNQFDEILERPKFQELDDVVTAFNQMTTQLRAHFNQQAEEADKLRIRAYQDPVSGLANRNYMMTQLESWLQSQNKGGIALLKVELLKDTYDQQGYEEGDNVTRLLSARLKEIISEEFTIARLNQSEFMLLAPNSSDEDMLQLGQSMLNMTASLQNDPLDIAPMRAAVALVMKQENDTISTILAHADNGLVEASTNRATPLFIHASSHESSTQSSFGKQQWKSIVDEAIANKQFTFSYQKAINRDNQLMHQEVFAAIQKDDVRYSAGQFLSAIESLDSGAQFDMHIIDEVFEQCKIYDPKFPIAINITQSSVNDTGFMRWLSQKMETNPSFSNRIYFELPEICFIKQPDNTKLLCNIIDSKGYQFGIDNFGHNFGSIGYLNAYRPAYVKLDFAYTSQIDDNVRADVITSITRTASNLDITTIASRVETMEQKDKLIELELGGFQGFVTEQINNDNEGQA